jgi:tRNA threonylcarbamoyladenosine biosynthesis protein TsaE
MEVITKSAKETKSLGEKYGSGLVRTDRPILLALSGDLGSGKTTFLQGLAKGLEIKRRVVSPTFILMRKYEAARGRVFYHIDLYRLDEGVSEELENLGFDEIVGESTSIIAVEWAEKAKEIFPKETVWINFEYVGKDKRKIVIKK